MFVFLFFFFFSSRRRHTRCYRDWSSECALPILSAPALPAVQKEKVVHVQVNFVRADGSTGSVTLDRGQVTATSSASLTIKRDDGKSVTFTIGAGAKVRGKLAVGGRALVFSRDGAAFRVLARATG